MPGYYPDLHTLRRRAMNRRQERDENFEPNRDITWGTVFSVGGSIFVPNTNESRVWVHILGVDESQSQAFRGDVLVLDGSPVKLTRYPKSPYIWRIIDVYDGTLDPFTMNLIVRHAIGPHAPNHMIPTEALIGPDPVYVYQPALKELRIEANGADLNIVVQPHVYWKDGAFVSFAGGVIDMTASVPSAGNIRKTLIYLDTADNVAKIVDGTEVLNNGIIPVPYPNLPTGGRAAGFVELVASQTVIVQSTDIEHARDFMGGLQYDYPALPSPAADSHILIGDDEGNWVSGKPVVDSVSGNIVTSGGNIVIA